MDATTTQPNNTCLLGDNPCYYMGYEGVTYLSALFLLMSRSDFHKGYGFRICQVNIDKRDIILYVNMDGNTTREHVAESISEKCGFNFRWR